MQLAESIEFPARAGCRTAPARSETAEGALVSDRAVHDKMICGLTEINPGRPGIRLRDEITYLFPAPSPDFVPSPDAGPFPGLYPAGLFPETGLCLRAGLSSPGASICPDFVLSPGTSPEAELSLAAAISPAAICPDFVLSLGTSPEAELSLAAALSLAATCPDFALSPEAATSSGVVLSLAAVGYPDDAFFP